MKVNPYDGVFYINQASSLAELSLIFERIVSGYGFDQFGVIYKTAEQHKNNLAPHHLANFSKEWLDHYFSSHYYEIDPVVLMGQEKIRPYLWSSLWDEVEMSKRQKDFFHEASEYGVAAGAGIPVFQDHPKPGIVTLVSSICSQEDVKKIMEEHHLSLTILATGFQNATRKFFEQIPPENAPHITAREKECLTWAAAGKTDSEIGTILNISHRTVNAHMANAYQKLGCVSREQAVVRALLMKLISV